MVGFRVRWLLLSSFFLTLEPGVLFIIGGWWEARSWVFPQRADFWGLVTIASSQFYGACMRDCFIRMINA